MGRLTWADLPQLLLRIAAVLVCIMVHEVSHGLAAYRLGDPTAKAMHRLSFNPLRHIDPFGALMMLLVGFGWAKPVPVDMRYFKHPKSGMAITALAGPVSNFLLAYLAYLCANTLLGAGILMQSWSGLADGAVNFCLLLAALSIGLGLFNLIPVPPLDGSKVLGAFLPDRTYYQILRYERFGMLALMLLLWSGLLDRPLDAVAGTVSQTLYNLACWPLRLMLGGLI